VFFLLPEKYLLFERFKLFFPLVKIPMRFFILNLEIKDISLAVKNHRIEVRPFCKKNMI